MKSIEVRRLEPGDVVLVVLASGYDQKRRPLYSWYVLDPDAEPHGVPLSSNRLTKAHGRPDEGHDVGWAMARLVTWLVSEWEFPWCQGNRTELRRLLEEIESS